MSNTDKNIVNVDELIAEAVKISALNDFGPFDIKGTLTMFVSHVVGCRVYTEEQFASVKQDIVRCLINRLRFQEDLKQHPEILDEDVSEPIIILGLGRSGTTKMHKMLSSPDSVQKTSFWRLWNPARFPNAEQHSSDPRIAAAGTSVLVTTESETIKAAHPMHAMEVEEEWLLYTLTFDDWIWCALLYVPSLFDWSMGRDRQAVYDYAKSLLQYLQWQDGGRKGRRWVLKSVGYIADLDAVNNCYPNATYLHTHRDPKSTIPSWTKFVSAIWNERATPVDPKEAGRHMLYQWSSAVERYLDSRQRLNLEDRILDVPYERVREDPMSIISELYQLAGMEMSGEAEAKMLGWHNSNEQYKNGRHSYSLEEFGLTNEMINEAFAEYIGIFI